MIRGSFVVWASAPKPVTEAGVGWAKVGATKAPCGGYRFAWFGRLKTSHRNSTVCPSRIWNSLDNAVFTMIDPGPNRLLFLRLPNVYDPGAAKAHGFHQYVRL